MPVLDELTSGALRGKPPPNAAGRILQDGQSFEYQNVLVYMIRDAARSAHMLTERCIATMMPWRGDEQFLARQRMDFLLMLEQGVRIVIEIDGRHHYAVPDPLASDRFIANAQRYAEMVAEDRRREPTHRADASLDC